MCTDVFGDRQSVKVNVESAGRHGRKATGRDQILIDTEHNPLSFRVSHFQGLVPTTL